MNNFSQPAANRTIVIRMIGKIKVQVEARPPVDPRQKLNWKDLPRRDWLQIHWDQYIGESERMIPLAIQNPHMFDRDQWEKLHARRQREHFDFIRGRIL